MSKYSGGERPFRQEEEVRRGRNLHSAWGASKQISVNISLLVLEGADGSAMVVRIIGVIYCREGRLVEATWGRLGN